MSAYRKLIMAVAIATLAAWPGPAAAKQTASGGSDALGGSITAIVTGAGGSGGSWERPSSGVTCTFEVPPGAPDEVYRILDGVGYLLHFRQCSNGTLEIIWVPQLTGRDLATIARDEVTKVLPAPRTKFAPPANQGVVHVGTWIWADPTIWQPVTATASIPGLDATVTATPHTLRFDPGDATHGTGPITCTGPGHPWEPAFGDDQASTCMYTYRHASTLSPGGTWPSTTTIDWTVRYTVSDGTGGDLGTLTTTATQPITVGEIQALITH